MLCLGVRGTAVCICSSAAAKLKGTALSLVGSIVPRSTIHRLWVGRLFCIGNLQDGGQPCGLHDLHLDVSVRVKIHTCHMQSTKYTPFDASLWQT
jgi:hypothetical protein